MKQMWLPVVLFLITGCGVDTGGVFSGGEVCTPGETQKCDCPDGRKGAQACDKAGTSYDKCECSLGGGDGGSGGGSTSSSSSSTGSGGTGTGAGGTGGNGGCTPLTVQEACAGFNCGSVSDNCGGTICCNPSGCNTPDQANYCNNENQYCGLGNVAVDGQGRATGTNNLPGTPNVCGGDCVLAELQYQAQCPPTGSEFPNDIHMYFCSRTDAMAPMPQNHGNCERSGPSSQGHWCCPN